MLFINGDGFNDIREAVNVTISELRRYPDLLSPLTICAAHGMNNALRWAIGVVDYGNIPRSAHVL